MKTEASSSQIKDSYTDCEIELIAWCKKHQRKLNGKKFKNITEDEWCDLHMDMFSVFVHFLLVREGKQKIKKALKTIKEWNKWFSESVDDQHDHTMRDLNNNKKEK